MGNMRFILRQLHDIAATVGEVLYAAKRSGGKKSRPCPACVF
jgi:hypothetical protein